MSELLTPGKALGFVGAAQWPQEDVMDQNIALLCAYLP